MIHFHYLGFFDPRMPIDLSQKPQKPAPPLPIRPLLPELYKPLGEKLGVRFDEEVYDLGGYLISHLGSFSFGELHPFEVQLVARGCVVLSEMRMVVQPPEAVELYNAAMAELAVKQMHP